MATINDLVLTTPVAGGVVGSTSSLVPLSQVLNLGVLPKLSVSGVMAANSSLILPIGALIIGISIVNTTANAVTGGIKIGSTLGGTDIVAALTVGANANAGVIPSALLKNFFSASATQTLFIDAVVAWNSASVNVTVYYTV